VQITTGKSAATGAKIRAAGEETTATTATTTPTTPSTAATAPGRIDAWIK